MASAKKKQDESEQDKPEEAAIEEQPQACGHINKQHYNTKGRLEDLACDLPAKHTGDHHAVYMKNVGEPVTDEKGRVTKTVYHEEKAETWWNDAAGQAVKDVAVGTVKPLNLHQRDLVMSILNSNPNMSAEDALTKAKASAEWNATQEPL